MHAMLACFATAFARWNLVHSEVEFAMYMYVCIVSVPLSHGFLYFPLPCHTYY